MNEIAKDILIRVFVALMVILILSVLLGFYTTSNHECSCGQHSSTGDCACKKSQATLTEVSSLNKPITITSL